jgi:hypothetical protein
MQAIILRGDFIKTQFLIVTKEYKAIDFKRWLTKGESVRKLKHLILKEDTEYTTKEILSINEFQS